MAGIPGITSEFDEPAAKPVASNAEATFVASHHDSCVLWIHHPCAPLRIVIAQAPSLSEQLEAFDRLQRQAGFGLPGQAVLEGDPLADVAAEQQHAGPGDSGYSMRVADSHRRIRKPRSCRSCTRFTKFRWGVCCICAVNELQSWSPGL